MNKKKENFQITKIRNGNGETIIIHRNKKVHNSGMHNCTNKLDNLGEMYVPRNSPVGNS